MVVLVTVIGRVLYDVADPDRDDPGAARDPARRRVRVLRARLRAHAPLIPSEDAAPPVTNFVVLPLYFLSGVFIPQSEIPDGVLDFSNLFPIRHFFECFLTGYDPRPPAPGSSGATSRSSLPGASRGLLLALRFFRWTPKSGWAPPSRAGLP